MGEKADPKSTKRDDLVGEQLVTYDVYAEMPDDGMRYEIIDGKLEALSPGPSFDHQSISGELEYLLQQGCKSDYVILHAPLDVIFSQTVVLQPDVIMIHRSRLYIVTKRGIEGPPDLVIEIVSPGSRKRDKVVKAKKYAEYGVAEYWIVDPEAKTLEQFRLAGGNYYESCNLFEGDEQVTSEKLPCVSFKLSDIFREMLDL